MKKLLTLILLATLALGAHAETKPQAGPNGGRLLALDGQKAEFLVEPDRTVTVTFYDEMLKRIAPSGQIVTAIADVPPDKTRLEFKPEGETLKSTTPLPDGEDYVIVVQIRPAAEARPRNFRITMLTHKCAECGLAEYACTCAH